MGRARNRWVRWFAIVLIAWAAFDALISLLYVLFPRHLGPNGFHDSWVTSTFDRYWSVMYPPDHPTIAKLTGLLRYGTTIVVCVAVIWEIRPRRRLDQRAAFERWQREHADLP